MQHPQPNLTVHLFDASVTVQLGWDWIFFVHTTHPLKKAKARGRPIEGPAKALPRLMGG